DSSKELHMSEGDQSHTGFSPSMTSCSKELRPVPHPKHLLQITTRTLKEPDFKFELLPLHSPLLRQSLLVSFPPLIDMLKFSGYPYPIRGQPGERRGVKTGSHNCQMRAVVSSLHVESVPPAIVFRTCHRVTKGPTTSQA